MFVLWLCSEERKEKKENRKKENRIETPLLLIELLKLIYLQKHGRLFDICHFVEPESQLSTDLPPRDLDPIGN